jgi:hypothetical protein
VWQSASTLTDVKGHPTPEEAVLAEDSVPRQYVNVVAVDYSPSRNQAVVLIEYNEPPTVEPYVVLCDNTPTGWVAGQGGSGGGVSWMSTDPDAELGVEVGWGPQPTVHWDVSPPSAPEWPPPSGARRW